MTIDSPSDVVWNLNDIVGGFIRRMEKWMLDQSYRISTVLLADPRPDVEPETPFAYPRMQEFQSRSQAIRDTLRELNPQHPMCYPLRHDNMVPHKDLGDWYYRALRTVRIHARNPGDIDPEKAITILAHLRALRHLMLEIMDVAGFYARHNNAAAQLHWDHRVTPS